MDGICVCRWIAATVTTCWLVLCVNEQFQRGWWNICVCRWTPHNESFNGALLREMSNRRWIHRGGIWFGMSIHTIAYASFLEKLCSLFVFTQTEDYIVATVTNALFVFLLGLEQLWPRLANSKLLWRLVCVSTQLMLKWLRKSPLLLFLDFQNMVYAQRLLEN